jgi:hypothetical protein
VKKKVRNFEGLPASVAANPSSTEGAFNTPLREPVPIFNVSPSEKVISGGNNSYIVLGRDRPSVFASGYGGKGHTQCGSIDIVVGRMSPDPKEIDEDGNQIIVEPNFYSDAARIHISQKTDVDKNFGLVEGSLGNSEGRSAIALKADHIRLMGREGIKIITKTDLKNSRGGDVRSVGGIDLIAGNDDKDLQPFVKGKNMVEAMTEMVTQVDKLNGIVDSLLMIQMQFNKALSGHFHHSPFFGIPTSPSIPVVQAGVQVMLKHFKDTKKSLMAHKGNLQFYKASYLTVSGDKWILSRYNNVN